MKKGFTLIELLAVIVILAIIALISTPIIIGLIDNVRKESFKDGAYGIVEAGELLYAADLLKGTTDEITFTYTDGVESSSIGGKELKYKGMKPQNGQVMVNTIGQIAIAIHNGSYCAEKGYTDDEITLSEKSVDECVISDDASGTDFIVSKGVNKPKLATGMTPIKWNGTTWVDTSVNDSDWYNYTSADKKWANARTADGSMWVWIPRYAYQLQLYHLSSTGMINIKFLQGVTNTDSDGNEVDITPTYQGGPPTQTNYIKHPAFTFGTTELTGIWVAKFEASGTTSAIDVKPNATSLKNIQLGAMFDASRSMENNSRYGWGTTGAEVDTHMMKNTEWGMVAYLAKSTYGINSEVGINNNSNYTTGCGAAVGSASSASCNTYNTATGMLASTTGNIYGIYDMSGGADEYVMGNYNDITGSSSLPLSIWMRDKYIDKYNTTNYGYNSTIYGDAIYETSSDAFLNGLSGSTAAAWYGDASYMSYASASWLSRGSSYSDGNLAGMFSFHSSTGGASATNGFRPVIMNYNSPVITFTPYENFGSSITISVTSSVGVDNSSLKYYVYDGCGTSLLPMPPDSYFTHSFTNNATISVSGAIVPVVWVSAKDINGNDTVVRSGLSNTEYHGVCP